MAVNKLLEEKQSNLIHTLNREEPKSVPSLITSSCAQVAWTGQKVTDIIYDPDKYVKAMTDVYGEMWVDGNIFSATMFTPRKPAMFPNAQNKFGPDGVTPEHVQRSPMKDDEYDLFNRDLLGYIRNVILPRMHPEFYSDPEHAREALKVIAEDSAYCMVTLMNKQTEVCRDKYGITDVVTFADNWENPLDSLFDRFRGFRGTLTDLRRHPKEVKQALDTIWNTFTLPAISRPLIGGGKMPYACQMAHIPAYLSPKQFDELYWPYEKKLIERVADQGGKSYIMIEGHWKNVWHHFLDVPKDSCILHVDDDDLFDAYKELGQHQIIMGGVRMADIRTKKLDDLKDQIKKMIDTCAPGGGYFFATDKAWIAPGDVNQTLIDVFNFAHDYSTKH